MSYYCVPYLQANSITEQIITDVGMPQNVVVEVIDEANGITLDLTTGVATVTMRLEASKYIYIVSLQIARNGACKPIIPDLRTWIRKNGEDVINSNVKMNVNRDNLEKDVLINSGLITLEQGDTFQAMMASNVADEVKLEFEEKEGEPDIPSVIFTLYKLGRESDDVVTP